jgi:hypothetical protein
MKPLLLIALLMALAVGSRAEIFRPPLAGTTACHLRSASRGADPAQLKRGTVAFSHAGMACALGDIQAALKTWIKAAAVGRQKMPLYAIWWFPYQKPTPGL